MSAEWQADRLCRNQEKQSTLTAPLLKSETNIRILLVEDNDISRQLMSDFLKYSGFSVLGLAEGTAFAETMAQFQPDLVLLDLKLPGIDGYALLQQFHHHSEWANTPVIVVSAFAFQADQQRALSLGARRYLVKPVRLPQLEEAIRDELEKRSM